MRTYVDIEVMRKLFEGAVESLVYAQEILTQLLHDTIRIDIPFTLDTNYALNVYHRELSRKEVVLGYEVLLPNLTKEEEKEVALFIVSTKESGYMVFATEDLVRVIGI
jgi:hypothetical protein